MAGTSPESIDVAEDRESWNALCARLEIPQPAGGTAADLDAALAITGRIGYPVLVRPCYVLGGRAMEIVYDDEDLARAMAELAGFGSLGKEGGLSAERPVLVDRFLEDATEVDVDAIRDARRRLRHRRDHGARRGGRGALRRLRLRHPAVLAVGRDHRRCSSDYTRRIADALGVIGLINVQYAVKSGQVFVIEANPRASRTVPFVAKATGVPLAKVASRVMMGATLAELRAEKLLTEPVEGDHVAVKEAVLPFGRFPEADALLGPEMRSTGEVMGIDLTFGLAFAKSQLAAGHQPARRSGTVFLSLADRDKATGVKAAQQFRDLGFTIAATSGTAEHLRANGIAVATVVAKIGDADGHDAVDLIASGDVVLVVNRPAAAAPAPTAPTSAPPPAATRCRCSPPRPPASPRSTA